MKQSLLLLSFVVYALTSTAQTPLQTTWRYYRPGNTGIQGDQATAIWVDAQGDPYIAASTGNWGEGGVAKWSVSSQRWTNYSNVDLPVLGSFDNAEVQIMDIVEDYRHRLWLGNFTGAVTLDPQIGASSMVRYDATNSGLQGYTTDMDVAPDSTIWFISGALVRYSPIDSQWTTLSGANTRLAVQPKANGGYQVWSADVYFGTVFTYNSITQQAANYLPTAVGDVAGLPGKDCVDDAGNFWALRMASNGDWETLEYQRPDGVWVHPPHPYSNVSFYIDAFKAYGDGKALLVTTNGETWMFDGDTWHNYGTWRSGDFNLSVDVDAHNNVWVCGLGGAAKRDSLTGQWQRYRITNTSQIDYFVEDISLDNNGDVWFTGNAATGIGGIQNFDGEHWTGFNPYTYGLGHDFPYLSDNSQAISYRPSSGEVVFNPTYHGVHSWNGTTFTPIENEMTTSEGFTEDSQGRLWSLGEYFELRRYDDSTSEWTSMPITGWGQQIRRDFSLPGTIWASTDVELLRTDGVNTFSRSIGDFPGTVGTFRGLAVDDQVAWMGTWGQFSVNGSTLIRLDAVTGVFQQWEHDAGWPFPGEHVSPMAVTPDGRLWLQYDSEFPSNDAGLCWFDGVNVGVFPAPPGGFPQWGGLPNSTIKDLEVREIAGGYELWMSCLGRGIAVLEVLYSPSGISDPLSHGPENTLMAFPNPTTEEVSFAFELDRTSSVQLAVFDLNGRKIKDLLLPAVGAGHVEMGWDLTDVSGLRVAAGMYIARVTYATGVQSVKIRVD